MKLPTSEYFLDPIVDTYLGANTEYPQTITASTLAVGSVAIPAILFGNYSWQRFLTDGLSEEQLDRAAAKIVTAHGSAIPFRPGLNEGEENGIKVFPRSRVNRLVQGVATEVGNVTINMLHHLQTDPTSSGHEGYTSEQKPFILWDRTVRQPAEVAAVAALFKGAHESLSASNNKTSSLRRDLHGNLRNFYTDPANYDEEMVNSLSARMSDLVLDGIVGSLRQADAWLGRTGPATFGNAFLREVVSGVAVPGRP